MFYLSYIFLSFLKPTIDWQYKKIEPISTLFPLENTILYFIFLNKFEKNLIEQKLNLLVWAFETNTEEDTLDSYDKIFDMLDKSIKTRFVFESNSAFSGNNFLEINDFAIVDTNIKLKNKKLLKLVFSSEKKIDSNIAKLVGYTYEIVDPNKILEIKSLDSLTQEKKVLDYIMKLEKERKQKRLKIVVCVFIGIVISILMIIAGIIVYFKMNK